MRVEFHNITFKEVLGNFTTCHTFNESKTVVIKIFDK